MTPSPEKAAPIPAEVPLTCPEIDRMLARHPELADDLEALRNSNSQLRYGLWHEKARADAAERKLADREARPSLPDSREERIRAEAAEDERDRLYAEACRPVPDNEENETIAALACAAATWLRLTQGVQPTARARQGGNNG